MTSPSPRDYEQRREGYPPAAEYERGVRGSESGAWGEGGPPPPPPVDYGRGGRGDYVGDVHGRRDYSPPPPPPVRRDYSPPPHRHHRPYGGSAGGYRDEGDYYDDYRGDYRRRSRRRSISPYGRHERDYRERDYYDDYRRRDDDYYGPPHGRGGYDAYGGGRRGPGGYHERKRGAPVERVTDEDRATSTTIWIGNLPYDYNEADVLGLFQKFGEIEKVTVPIDRQTTKNKGFAFIQFINRNEAVEAFEHFKGATLDGRRIKIDWDVKKSFADDKTRSEE